VYWLSSAAICTQPRPDRNKGAANFVVPGGSPIAAGGKSTGRRNRHAPLVLDRSRHINAGDDDGQPESWIGRSETRHDLIGATPALALNATLDHPETTFAPGTPLLPLWHWLYFLPLHRQSEIGADGHAKRGGFLPPVPLPRRMWAGSQFEFRSPVRVGDAVERTSTIADVSSKEGRTGQLVFVKVRHEVRCNGAADPAIVEFHDIVYREAKRPTTSSRHRSARTQARHGNARSCPTTCCCPLLGRWTFTGPPHPLRPPTYVTEVEGSRHCRARAPARDACLLGPGAPQRARSRCRELPLSGPLRPDLRPGSVYASMASFRTTAKGPSSFGPRTMRVGSPMDRRADAAQKGAGRC
jgi:3-methylfumaryl-CoA hydratase